ncbi:hypothetical protein DPMN_131890 [Dreissena polymorpha]|uniref:Uncharacterized protein n=1 Tax=Dreissena polymorpha TaxID=45954 RepID=A0A9D4FVR8_DREPO|nr:hypothetical protein DPMN_131890 [Dreissena polymorpha]
MKDWSGLPKWAKEREKCESLREGRETLDKKLDNMQRRLHSIIMNLLQGRMGYTGIIMDTQAFFHKHTMSILKLSNGSRQELLQRIEESERLAEVIMDQYQETTNRLKKMVFELDAALREKESVKIEMSIMEAKFENAQRVLEADLHSTMEKQIADVQARRTGSFR